MHKLPLSISKKIGMLKSSAVTFSQEVSLEEKSSAEHVREQFSEFLAFHDKLEIFLGTFYDSLDKIESPKQLVKIAPVIKKYEIKLVHVINNYIRSLGLAINEYNNNFSDTELDNLRDLVVEHAKKLRTALIELINIMQDISNDNFVSDSKVKYQEIVSSMSKIKEIVKDEMFSHIDYDILGRIRLSGFNIPLSKRKRG